eukprot:11453177-Prorocentrum_lima.AAC.1
MADHAALLQQAADKKEAAVKLDDKRTGRDEEQVLQLIRDSALSFTPSPWPSGSALFPPLPSPRVSSPPMAVPLLSSMLA